MINQKNILITGASSGVGKALSIHLSKRFHVIALSRREEQMQQSFSDNGNISYFSVDLTDDTSLENILHLIKKKYGNIDYIINNAGVMKSINIHDMNLENDLDYSVNLNAMVPIKIIRFFLKDMKEFNFGRIINLTSGAPLNCFENFGAYSASKSILNSLTITLAKELKTYNIKINLMSPGPVKSEMAPDAPMEPEVCFPTVDYLLDLDNDGYSGGFFWLGYKVPLFPDLDGVEWLNGIGNSKLQKVL